MSIRKYQKDGRMYFMVYLNLRSKTNPSLRKQARVLNLTSLDEARKTEAKIFEELKQKLIKEEGYGLTWAEVISKWEESMHLRDMRSVEYAKTTILDHAALLRKWSAPWLEKEAASLVIADARELLMDVVAQGKSHAFQRKVKNTINVVYTWGLENKLIRGAHMSPVHGMKLSKQGYEKNPEILSLSEIRTLLSQAKNLSHPWYPIWSMALLTGMRSGELHALTWMDLDLEDSRIIVSKSYNPRLRKITPTKARYWRTVPISTELASLLQTLRNQNPKVQPSDFVLPRFWEWDRGEQARILRKFCLGISIKQVRFHTLRACFATQLLNHDVAPAQIMKICGWKDLKTMQYYVRLAGVDERGATQRLKVLPSDADVTNKVVQLFQETFQDVTS